jgi:hypothetical protein
VVSLTWREVCRIGREFDGVVESTSYGTPALKAKGKLLVRLREDSETLVLMTTFIDRDLLLRDKPKTFFIEEHYRNYPAILTRLSRIGPVQLRDMIEAALARLQRKPRVDAGGAPGRKVRRRGGDQ